MNSKSESNAVSHLMYKQLIFNVRFDKLVHAVHGCEAGHVVSVGLFSFVNDAEGLWRLGGIDLFLFGLNAD